MSISLCERLVRASLFTLPVKIGFGTECLILSAKKCINIILIRKLAENMQLTLIVWRRRRCYSCNMETKLNRNWKLRWRGYESHAISRRYIPNALTSNAEHHFWLHSVLLIPEIICILLKLVFLANNCCRIIYIAVPFNCAAILNSN